MTSASFDLFGSQGGGSGNGQPGLGGHATVTIPLTPGDSIQVNVGGQGQPLFGTGVGGFNGGGNAGPSGSSGGGASDIRIGGTTLNQRVLVAGGGGGGGNSTATGGATNGGGGGGLNGADGTTSCTIVGPSGGGGTQTMGGSATSPATMGSPGLGGNGANFGGGGGGGGSYGGGGGSLLAGGGGGSGHGPTGTSFETGVRSGDGQVTITYTANPTPPANPTVAPGKDPKCKKLRKKLKHQQKNLAKAGSEKKQAMIQDNIADTKRRLTKLGC